MSTRSKRVIGGAFLKAFGWTCEGEVPEPRRFVLIAAPHTSNWDLAFMLAVAWSMGFDVSWMGKHTLFEAPGGGMLRWLRGIPIDRRSPQGIVEQMTGIFATEPELILAVPPEGTRARVEHWKSGFYTIAHAANVPICLGFLDYDKKRGGLGPLVYPTGDVEADMAKIRAFYADKLGKYPDRFATPRLRSEAGAANGPAGA